MKAVRIHGYGGIDQLVYEDVETPQPRSGEVLIQLAATSVNPVDWKIRSGAVKDRMPVEFPAILGRDAAGVVEQAGTGVRNPLVGQRVMALVRGSYAQYVIASAEQVTVIPDGLNSETAGALPLVVTTGAQLIQHIQPRHGQTLLVTGAAGSVGRSAVYYAKTAGACVLAGVKAGQKEDAETLGADQVVVLDDEGAIAALPALDAIADTVDHDVIARLLPKLKNGGVLGSVLGQPKEAEGRNIRVEAFMAKPDASLLRQMADAVRDRKLTIPIAKTVPLSAAREAHALAEKGAGGKVLLLP